MGWFFVLVVVGMGLSSWSVLAAPENINAGDVFAVKRVHFPAQSLDATQSREARIEVADYRVSPGDISLSLIVYDDRGIAVPGHDFLLNLDAGGPLSFSYNVDQPNSLVVGKTYSLFVRIDPGMNEIVLGNNSGTALFAVIQPGYAVPVPDASPGMSLLLVGGVMGWLFLSTRGVKQKISANQK